MGIFLKEYQCKPHLEQGQAEGFQMNNLSMVVRHMYPRVDRLSHEVIYGLDK
jgi:hypothetical protein